MSFALIGHPAFDPVIAFTVSLAAAATGPALARLSRRRTLAQPVPQDAQAEYRVLGALLGNPSLIVEMDAFTADAFTGADRRRAWELLEERFPDRLGRGAWQPGDQPPRDSAQEPPGAHSDVADYAAEHLDPDLLGRCRQAADGIGVEEARKSGETVLGLAYERTAYVGAASLREDAGELRWAAPMPGWRRNLASAAWMALTGLLAAALVPLLADSALSMLLVPLSVLVLGAASLAWSLVDADTLYLDLKSFTVGSALAGTLAAGAAVAAGHPAYLLAGAGAAAACGIVLAGSSVAYRALRGTEGMGLGDSLIVTATVGVPVTLTGSLMLGYWAFMSSLVAGIAGAAGAALLRRGRGLRAPFAFGPYLAIGWLVATCAWAVQQ